MTSGIRLGISTRAADFRDPTSSLRLGGTTLYAPGEEVLRNTIRTVADGIARCASAHTSLTRVTLNSEVRKQLKIVVPRRIFGAILGSQLRLGVLDSVPCAAITGNVFRVYIHHMNIELFGKYLETTKHDLKSLKIVSVSDIEQKLFGRRKWGTWSSTAHVLSRLVQIGFAYYVDQNHFRWPQEIVHALE